MDDLALIDHAREARTRAHAPYSGYAVGAALRDDRGRIHSGCNIENVSFGATLCAERVAVAHMVASGGRVVTGLVVATEDGGTPCGICLQTLLEFAPIDGDLAIVIVSEAGVALVSTLKELLPAGFASKSVAKRTKGASSAL